MITCHLTKLETAVDSVKKSYPKLKPADAALLASALVVTGRHALAVYDGGHYKWPEEYDKLTGSMVSQLEMVQQGIEQTTKKTAKSAPEEEPVLVAVGLAPNISAGEALLKGRDDLKALLSEVIKEGVEFAYAPMDIGWQWALDRVNWSTVSGGELSRRIKIKATFTEGAVGMEMGSGAKKRSTKKAAAAPAPATAPAAEAKVEAKPAQAAEAKPKAEPKKVEAKAKPEPKAVVKPEPKKPEPKKVEAKKPEPKKAEPKKAAVKKVEPKKAAPKKPEPKKAAVKKTAPKPTPKKVEPKKAAPKKVEVKKAAAKKPAQAKAKGKPAPAGKKKGK